jgi:hypothetical protein
MPFYNNLSQQFHQYIFWIRCEEYVQRVLTSFVFYGIIFSLSTKEESVSHTVYEKVDRTCPYCGGTRQHSKGGRKSCKVINKHGGCKATPNTKKTGGGRRKEEKKPKWGV